MNVLLPLRWNRLLIAEINILFQQRGNKTFINYLYIAYIYMWNEFDKDWFFDNLKNKCECPIVFGEYINLYDTTFILIINNIW